MFANSLSTSKRYYGCRQDNATIERTSIHAVAQPARSTALMPAIDRLKNINWRQAAYMHVQRALASPHQQVIQAGQKE